MDIFKFLNTGNLKNAEIYLKVYKKSAANPELNYVPAYHFIICRIRDGVELGICDLRIGHNEGTYYGGNIGYEIYPEFRGNHFAGKACMLLFELAKNHGMNYLYITCNPDNTASRKTCEFAGGILEGIVDLPPDNDMYKEGERQKCIFSFILKE